TTSFPASVTLPPVHKGLPRTGITRLAHTARGQLWCVRGPARARSKQGGKTYVVYKTDAVRGGVPGDAGAGGGAPLRRRGPPGVRGGSILPGPDLPPGAGRLLVGDL